MTRAFSKCGSTLCPLLHFERHGTALHISVRLLLLESTMAEVINVAPYRPTCDVGFGWPRLRDLAP